MKDKLEDWGRHVYQTVKRPLFAFEKCYRRQFYIEDRVSTREYSQDEVGDVGKVEKYVGKEVAFF